MKGKLIYSDFSRKENPNKDLTQRNAMKGLLQAYPCGLAESKFIVEQK